MKKINIKKGAIALAFITTIAFTTPGCGATIDDITYATDASGYIDSIEGTVSYEFLEQCHFIKVNNMLLNETYYSIGICDIVQKTFGWNDVFTRQNYENSNVFEVEYFEFVTDWLDAIGKVKAEYTEEELRELLNIFIEKEVKDKQLVKE